MLVCLTTWTSACMFGCADFSLSARWLVGTERLVHRTVLLFAGDSALPTAGDSDRRESDLTDRKVLDRFDGRDVSNNTRRPHTSGVSY